MRNGRLRVQIVTSSVGRRKLSYLLSRCGILFIIAFIFCCLHFIIDQNSDSEGFADANESAAAILNAVPKGLHKFLTSKRSINGTAPRVIVNTINITEIKLNIDRVNEQQYVHNEEIFGPVQNNSLIIVVQVHTRITYLRHLIVSLAQANDIDTVLLIFSHDHYDEEINELVESIDFCKVMQIFFPYAIQTHPNSFPGPSPGDCPRDMKRDEAVQKGCFNALWPDLYGHYREAKFTQTKHHWWWKANRVFNELDVTRNHYGLVLFLEEDHYVAEDFINMLQLMQQTAVRNCAKCNIFSLGTYLKTYNYYADGRKRGINRPRSQTTWNFQNVASLSQHYNKMEVTPWISSKHNMGMAFNRTVWSTIKACASHFCTFDDYNWDWSLQRVSNDCLRDKLHVMMARGPRVFHIGECGFHHKKKNCEATVVISRVQQVLKVATKYMYPTRLTLVYTAGTKKQKIRKGNGGWSDLRDHQLCMNISISTL